jgi:hypothetical protein
MGFPEDMAATEIGAHCTLLSYYWECDRLPPETDMLTVLRLKPADWYKISKKVMVRVRPISQDLIGRKSKPETRSRNSSGLMSSRTGLPTRAIECPPVMKLDREQLSRHLAEDTPAH